MAGVRLDRLPQVGDAPAPAADATPPAAAPVADDRPAWQRYAAAAPQAEPARPPLALVLADPGGQPLAEAALLALPMPVTVALDPFDPDAPRRAALYRAAGHEIVLSLDAIAPRATASDLEVLFAAWARDFPQALGVIETPPGDGRRARALAPVLMPLLADLGLALVAPDRGLSPLLAAARAAGLPLAGLYRQIDDGGADAGTIRRHLDRAGFEAERLGRIAVFGRADAPATLPAIAEWLTGARAARVAPGAVGAALSAP